MRMFITKDTTSTRLYPAASPPSTPCCPASKVPLPCPVNNHKLGAKGY